MTAFGLVGFALLAVVLAGGGFLVGRAVERSSALAKARLEEERRMGYLQGQEDQRRIDGARPGVTPPDPDGGGAGPHPR